MIIQVKIQHEASSRLHGVISQKRELFTNTTVRTSNPILLISAVHNIRIKIMPKLKGLTVLFYYYVLLFIAGQSCC
jgi:hypothetical protein